MLKGLLGLILVDGWILFWGSEGGVVVGVVGVIGLGLGGWFL